jgi:TetR/AcrR family transcriptional regulator, regulator of mycofactocin system
MCDCCVLLAALTVMHNARVTGTKGRSGRPAATSHEEIAHLAQKLFEDKGFAATSVTEIAAEAGIGRRTFFGYFASKADVFWWSEEEDLRSVELALAASPRGGDHPVKQVIDASKRSPSWVSPTKDATRARYLMIEGNPDLQIGSQRYQRRWHEVIAHHIRERIGPTSSDLLPEAIAATLIGVAQAVLVRWMTTDDQRTLSELFDENFTLVRRIFEETVADDLLK